MPLVECGPEPAGGRLAEVRKAPGPALAAARVALVVGAALDRIGFDVTVLENLDEDAMDGALGEFEEGRRLRAAESLRRLHAGVALHRLDPGADGQIIASKAKAGKCESGATCHEKKSGHRPQAAAFWRPAE